MPAVNVKRLLVFCVCCLCHLIWGSITTPTYYINAFKVQYNYTQSQVEVILPVISFGKILSVVPAAVYQTCGVRPTLLVGLTLSTGGYFFLWASRFFLGICYMYPAVMYTCFFLMGFGSGFLNLSVITTITKNFTGKHQGKAVSTVMTSYAVSPLITLLVYRKWFAHDQIENDAEQNFHGFMFYCAITTATMGCVFLGVARLKTESELLETPLLQDTESEELFKRTSKVSTALRTKTVQELKAIFHWPLQLMIWSFALIFATVAGIDYNLAVYAKSSGEYALFDGVFVVFHLTLFLSRLAVGCISDALAGTIPRTSYIAVTSFFLAVCFCIMSILPTSELTMYMLSITTGLAGGVAKPVLVTVLAQNMERDNFAKYWGIANSLLAISLAVWAAVFSSLYSAGGQKGQDCNGSHCLRWINVVSCAMTMVSMCCSLALALVKRY